MSKDQNPGKSTFLGRFRFTFRQRIILGNLALGLTILTASIISIIQINRLTNAGVVMETAQQQYSTVLVIRQTSAELINLINRLLPSENAAVFESEVSSVLAILRESSSELDWLIEAGGGSEEANSLLRMVHDDIDSVIAISETMIRQAAEGQWPSVGVRIGVLDRNQQQLAERVDRLAEISGEIDDVAAEEVVSARQVATFLPIFTVIISSIIGLLLLWQTTRSVAIPVERLSEGVKNLTAGSLDRRIIVESDDELGQLASAFNNMAEQLQLSYAELEERVHERTQALQISSEQNARLYEQMRKRAQQLQISAEISQTISGYLDLNQLLSKAVDLISEAFDIYQVSILLLDDKKEHLILSEATGDIGKKLKEERFELSVTPNSIIGQVALNKRAYISQDITKDPFFMTDSLLPDTRSEMALPLIAHGEHLGVLDTQSKEIEAFSEEDKIILQILANQVAINIANTRLFTQTQTQLDETKALFDLNTLLTTTLDEGEIYHRAARALTELLHVSCCIISSWEPEKDTITIQAESIDDGSQGIRFNSESEQISYNLTDFSRARELLENHEPVIQNLDDLDLEIAEKQRLQERGQSLGLVVPLVVGNKAVGIVNLYRDESHALFSQSEIQLAQAMANQTATALNNAGLTTEAREGMAQLSTINRFSTLLSLAPKLSDVFNGVRDEVFNLVDAVGMSIMLLTPEKDKLHWIYGYEYGQEVDLSILPPLPVTRGFSGHVARNREVLLINEEVNKMHEKLQSETVGASPDAWLGLPLIVANELIGVLAIENDSPFPDAAVDLLKTIAGPVAIAIHNLIQLEEVQTALEAQYQQRVQLQVAAEVAAAATSALKPDELMQQSVDLIKERFALYYVGLFLVDPNTNQAVLQAGTGKAAEVQIEQNHQLTVGGRSLIGGATGDGQPRIIQDVTLDEEWYPNPSLPDTRSELALPLRVREHIIGALTVQSSKPDAFNPELISVLQTLCDQLAVAIENAQLLVDAEARAQYQQKLNEVSAQLYRSTDVDRIISISLEALSERLNGARVALSLGRNYGDFNWEDKDSVEVIKGD